jgi:uncharacterized protein
LVHVSQLADRFVKDPHEIVKAGDVVRVRVTEVDVPRKRIGLSMRQDEPATESPRGQVREKSQTRHTPKPVKPPQAKSESKGAFGSALADALKRGGGN